MSRKNSTVRVSGGIPWWIWLFCAVATVGVVLAVVAELNRPAPAQVFDDALAALENRDKEGFLEQTEILRSLEPEGERLAVLEGIADGLTRRDPGAIEKLQPFLSHDNVLYQRLAQKYSGMAYERLCHAARARQLYENCAELDPSSPDAWRLLMNLCHSSGALAPALDYAGKLLAVDPGDQAALEIIPSIHRDLGRTDIAIQKYEELLDTPIERATISPEAVNDYMRLLLEVGKEDVAGQFLEENMALVTDLRVKVDVLLKNGRISETEEILNESSLLENDPQFIRLRAARAAESGRGQVAIDLLRPMILESPRDTALFEMLESLARREGQSRLADICRQNIEELQKHRRTLRETIAAIGQDLETPELRIEVARIAAELWRPDYVRKWAEAAERTAGERQFDVRAEAGAVSLPRSMLVPFDTPPQGAAGDRSLVAPDGSLLPQPLEPDNPVDSEDGTTAPDAREESEEPDPAEQASEKENGSDSGAP